MGPDNQPGDVQRTVRAVATSGPVLFAVIGVLNTLLDWVVFTLLIVYGGWGPAAANVAGFAAGGVQSYVLNGAITFRSGQPRAQPQTILRFGLVTLVCLALSTAMVHVLAPLITPWAAKLLATIATFIVGFLAHKAFTFAPPRSDP
jgi:putative flippase GtrA